MRGTPTRKIREFCCELCELVWEARVYDSERESQVCESCEQPAVEKVTSPTFWDGSPEAEKEKLKRRSRDHMDWCRRTGNHPSSTGDRNPRSRARNTSTTTIAEHKHTWKKWKREAENNTDQATEVVTRTPGKVITS